MESIVAVTRAMFLLLFLIHMLSCLWIVIGRSNDSAWIESNPEFNSSENVVFHSYPAAAYFITVTLTTVGYGDILPHTKGEILFVMVIELVGLTTFSYILGVLKSVEFSKSSVKLIKEKKKGVLNFLNTIDKNNRKMEFPTEIINKTLENLDVTYNYSYNYVFHSHDFFEQIKPNLKQSLMVNTLSQQYIKFSNFFS